MSEDGTAPSARAEAAGAVAVPDAPGPPPGEEPAAARLSGCLSTCLSALALLLGGIGLLILYFALRDHFLPGHQLSKPVMGLFLALAFLAPAGLLGGIAYALGGVGRRRP